jgi:hypothetical protein
MFADEDDDTKLHSGVAKSNSVPPQELFHEQVILFEGLPTLHSLTGEGMASLSNATAIPIAKNVAEKRAEQQKLNDQWRHLIENYQVPLNINEAGDDDDGAGSSGVQYGQGQNDAMVTGSPQGPQSETRVQKKITRGGEVSSHIYLFPGSVKQLHPEFDSVIWLLLKTDPYAIVVLATVRTGMTL